MAPIQYNGALGAKSKSHAGVSYMAFAWIRRSVGGTILSVRHLTHDGTKGMSWIGNFQILK